MSAETPTPKKKRRTPRIGRIFLLLLFCVALAVGVLVWMTWQVIHTPGDSNNTTSPGGNSHNGVEILTPPKPIGSPPTNPLAPLRPDNSEAFSASGLEQPPSSAKPTATQGDGEPHGIPIEPLREIRPLNQEYPVQPTNSAPDRTQETPIPPTPPGGGTPTDNLF